MQPKAVTPATSNSKDDSNGVTALNSSNSSNSRNESNNRTAKTLGTEAKSGDAKSSEATACKEDNYSRDTVNIRNDSSRDKGTSWMSTAAGPPKSDRRKKSATVQKTARLQAMVSSLLQNSPHWIGSFVLYV
jgi:hypothetical protein